MLIVTASPLRLAERSRREFDEPEAACYMRNFADDSFLVEIATSLRNVILSLRHVANVSERICFAAHAPALAELLGDHGTIAREQRPSDSLNTSGRP